MQGGEGPRVGDEIAGYRIDSVLGRGGMGIVFRAHQERLERDVAVKVVAPELASDEGFRERFIRESRIAASIEHPNVLPIHAAGETDDGTLYIVMRYVEGSDLKELIGAGPLEPERAIAIIDQVAGALDEAHRSGLVHRDVKPANILVSERGGAERAFLTDFGLTKRSASAGGLTATGQWVGTIDYAAPEQIEGKRVDGRADVYSLGCVAFEALSGRVPYERETDVAKLWAHVQDPAPSLAELVEGLPGHVTEAVAKAMAKDPGERFQSAGELGASLRGDTGAASAAAPVAASAAGTAPAPAPPKRRRLPGRTTLVVGLALAAAAAALAIVLAGGDDDGPGPAPPVPADVEVAEIAIPGSLSAVAPGRDRIFVGSENPRRVFVVRADAEEKLFGEIDPRTRPTDLGLIDGTDLLVVMSERSGTIRYINLESGRPVLTEPSVGAEPKDLEIGEIAIWVASSDGAVTRVFLATDSPQGAAVRVGGEPVAVAELDQAAWVADRANDAVVKLDAFAGEVDGDPIEVGSRPAGIAAADGVVWVSNSGDDTVTRIEADSGELIGEPISVGSEPTGIAISEGVAWVVNSGEDTVSRLDARSGEPAGPAVPVAPGPVDVSVHPEGRFAGAIWVLSREAGVATRIRPRR